MDLISRQTALDALGLSEKTRKHSGDGSGYDTRMLYEIQDILEGLPSAEPEIIHCKDCDGYLGDGRCVHDDDLWGDDDFCSRAERRTDG